MLRAVPAVSAVLALALAGPASTRPSPLQDPEPSGPRAVLEALDGSVRRIPLDALDTADPRELGAVLVRFEGLAPLAAPPAADRARLELVDGGRAFGVVDGGEGESLWLRLLGGARLRLGVEEVAQMTFPGRVPADWTGQLEAAPEGDRLYRARSGGLDRIEGFVESFSADGVRFESSLGSRLYPWEEVCALFVEALEPGASRPPDVGVPVAVDLLDGSRLRGELLALDAEDALSIATHGGRGLKLPLAAVGELRVEDERLRFVSELEPTRVEEPAPFGDDLGVRWPYRVDREVAGGPLVCGGQTYTRGLGVHAPSRLVYALDGSWNTLRGAVCVDDGALRLAWRGSVRFRVLCDEQERFASPVLSAGDAPVELPAIDVSGVRTLELVAESVEHHVADRADWLRLRLVR